MSDIRAARCHLGQRRGPAQPMPDLFFRGMALAFRVRDWIRPRAELLDEVPLRAGDRVVDYGCGPGAFIPELASRVGNEGAVVAVDIHPLALKQVRALARRHQLRNVTAHLGDGVHIPDVDDGGVDVVLLADIFHMLSDSESVLAEILRVLRPDGVLAVQDPHMDRGALEEAVVRLGCFQVLERRQHLTLFEPGAASAPAGEPL